MHIQNQRELVKIKIANAVTEHRMVELGRDLRDVGKDQKSPVSTLLLEEGHLGPVAHVCAQKALDCVQGWSLHNLFGQPVLVSATVTVAKCLLTLSP